MQCALIEIRAPQYRIWNLKKIMTKINSVDTFYQGSTTHISLDKETEIGINDMIAVYQGDI